MLLDEKRYPNGINPVVSDEVSEDVAYQMKESGIDLHGEFSRKLATIGRELVVNSENDRSYDQLMETLRDLDILMDDIKEAKELIEDTMEEERKRHVGYALNILRRAE